MESKIPDAMTGILYMRRGDSRTKILQQLLVKYSLHA